MIRETFSVGVLAGNCTVLGDEVSREAVVVDPGQDLQRILAVIEKHALRVKIIFITHAHIDHIGSAADLKSVTGAPIYYHKRESTLVKFLGMQARWIGVQAPDIGPPDHSPRDNERIGVQGIEGVALHTPGHSPGSLCLHIPSENLLIAGDTLFAGSLGTTDLPGGDREKLLCSVRERLFVLPGETIVVPGHGPDTTIAAEKLCHPHLAITAASAIVTT